MGAGGEDSSPIFQSPGSPAETSSRQAVGSLDCVCTAYPPSASLGRRWCPFFKNLSGSHCLLAPAPRPRPVAWGIVSLENSVS